MKQNHITSLRLSLETHKAIVFMANAWGCAPAFVYRTAIKQFVQSKGGLNV